MHLSPSRNAVNSRATSRCNGEQFEESSSKSCILVDDGTNGQRLDRTRERMTFGQRARAGDIDRPSGGVIGMLVRSASFGRREKPSRRPDPPTETEESSHSPTDSRSGTPEADRIVKSNFVEKTEPKPIMTDRQFGWLQKKHHRCVQNACMSLCLHGRAAAGPSARADGACARCIWRRSPRTRVPPSLTPLDLLSSIPNCPGSVQKRRLGEALLLCGRDARHAELRQVGDERDEEGDTLCGAASR